MSIFKLFNDFSSLTKIISEFIFRIYMHWFSLKLRYEPKNKIRGNNYYWMCSGCNGKRLALQTSNFRVLGKYYQQQNSVMVTNDNKTSCS